MGFPWLKGSHRQRVELANQIYFGTADFCELLTTLRIPWTIENPTNSWFWELPCMTRLLSLGHMCDLHACAYGGSRPKLTSFLGTVPGLESLSKFCPGDHEHRPWGVDEKGQFRTAEEAEYPKELAAALAPLFVDACGCFSAKHRERPHKQARGRGTPQLISEYGKVLTVYMPDAPAVDAKRCLVTECGPVPAGARLLRTEADTGRFKCVFGIYRTKEQFLERAKELWRPYDTMILLPDEIVRALFEVLTKEPLDTCKWRLQCIQQWQRWATECESAEKDLKLRVHKDVRSIVAHLRISLMKKVGAQIGWTDATLWDQLADGFRLVGDVPFSGVFKEDFKPASLNEDELFARTRLLKPLIMERLMCDGRSEFTAALSDLTREEAESKGWLEGPLEIPDIEERSGGKWILVKRFHVVQRGKIRPIDDFSQCAVNDAFGCCERVELRTLDELLWACIILVRHCKHMSAFEYPLSDGAILSGPVSSGWGKTDWSLRVGAIDLKSAYKQLPLHPADTWKAVIGVPAQKMGKVDLYRALTFKFAKFLWKAGTFMRIIWGNYFDDFPMICPTCLNSSNVAAATAMLRLFGVVQAEDKLQPGEHTAEILGTVVDVSNSQNGVVSVKNKESRTLEICESLQQILERGFLETSELPPILGRIQFADMQLAGRHGKLALCDLREAAGSCDRIKVVEEVEQAVRTVMNRLQMGRPRDLKIRDKARPVLVFVDGALSDGPGGQGCGSIGAVLFQPARIPLAFGANVPTSALAAMRADGASHVIGSGLWEMTTSVILL